MKLFGEESRKGKKTSHEDTKTYREKRKISRKAVQREEGEEELTLRHKDQWGKVEDKLQSSTKGEGGRRPHTKTQRPLGKSGR